MNSLYDTLQVIPQADREVIQASYRVLMRKHHPDAGGSTQKAQEINNAYDTIGDDNRRKVYDAKNPNIFASRINQDTYTKTAPRYVNISCVDCDSVFNVKIENYTEEFAKTQRCPKCGGTVFKETPVTGTGRKPGAQSGAAQEQNKTSGAQQDQNAGTGKCSDIISHANRTIRRLQQNGWQASGDKQGYFDCILSTPYFLKNHVYIKIFDKLDSRATEEFAAQCEKRFDNRTSRLLPTGHCFLAVSRSVADENQLIEKSRSMSGAATGFSTCAMAPVSFEKKRAFFHHINRNAFPQEVFDIGTDIFK